MKVETFLQHCNSREKFTPEEEADARKFFVDRGVRYIRDWYSQPFKPELITELFEGWDKSFHIRMNGKMIPDGLLVHEYANVINPKRQEINLYMPVMEKIESMTESQVEEWIEDNWGGDIYWENQIDYGDGGHQWHFPVPTTLDMFITDCHRHKLILQWKEI